MFLSRRYRPNLWPFYALIGIELCLTVALLTFTGIAAPNLYRTKLWQDGADNGFNSSPSAGLYAAANYRPYTTPRVWSQFITNYNLVIVVLSMFLMLVKGTMYMLHVLPPIVSALLHVILIILYSVAVSYQASSDTSDPRHPQKGPAWYITKSCSVVHDRSLLGYCQQAKATFACFVTMLVVFIVYCGLSVWSCVPSKAQKQEYEEKCLQKKLRWAHLDDPEPRTGDAEYIIPETPGIQLGMSPVTPRTLAFNTLGGTRGLAMRAPEKTNTNTQSSTFSLRSPGMLRTPMTLGPQTTEEGDGPPVAEQTLHSSSGADMYFPPPPKESNKRAVR